MKIWFFFATPTLHAGVIPRQYYDYEAENANSKKNSLFKLFDSLKLKIEILNIGDSNITVQKNQFFLVNYKKK
jgi:hypothetical protein